MVTKHLIVMWIVTLLDSTPVIPIKILHQPNRGLDMLSYSILWVSKMQTQCALSTMESEYLALSQAMRDIVPLREIMKEINKEVFDNVIHMPKYTAKSKSFSDIVSTAQENPLPKSKVNEDNEAYLKFAQLPRLTPRTKHIVVPYH